MVFAVFLVVFAVASGSTGLPSPRASACSTKNPCAFCLCCERASVYLCVYVCMCVVYLIYSANTKNHKDNESHFKMCERTNFTFIRELGLVTMSMYLWKRGVAVIAVNRHYQHQRREPTQ